MPEKLDLDPGRSLRRKPLSTGICKRVCCILGLPLFSLAAWAIVSYGNELVDKLRFPHKTLYHSDPSYDPGDVIRPLISDEQTFDIAVTVWLRAPKEDEAEYKKLKALILTEEPASPFFSVDFGTPLGRKRVTAGSDEGNNMFRDEDVLEKALFSDIVFRGLRLSTKHASAKIDFRMPTERFIATDLSKSDLRATFLLMPSSPSLIDHVKNFSSWIPDAVYSARRTTRPWPFPLGSDERGERTMADLALESFSIFIPLLEFHDAASQCSGSTANKTVGAIAETSEDAGSVVSGHPYVITRTQLRIIRETRLFDANLYNVVHDGIKLHSCGQGIPGIRPNLRMCRRTYKSQGNFETRLELEVPTEHGVETQWAYAPYLDTKAHAAGPLDIIPVPVNRENCSSAAQEKDKDYMDVSWRIAFSGRTPAKQILGDNFVDPALIDHRASKMTKVTQQDSAELWNGAFGHRFHDDAHPRRRIVIGFVSTGCLLLSQFLQFHYWWTRVSTAGVSTSSVFFLALGNTSSELADAFHDEDAVIWIIALLDQIVPILMCKVILRNQFGWKKWYPTLTRVPANHQERASQRIDNRTSWRAKLGVLVVGIAIHRLLNPEEFILVPTTGPVLRPEEFSPLDDSQLFALFKSTASCSVYMGVCLQVLFNYRSSAYGGGYRAQIILLCFGTVLGLISHFVPAVAGRMEWRMGMSLNSLNVILYLPLFWQAITLPPFEIVEEE